MPEDERKQTLWGRAVLDSSRENAIGQLENVLLNRPGSPRLLVLTGAPGVGKTFLVQLALERTKVQDAVVCSAWSESQAELEPPRLWLSRHKWADGKCLVIDEPALLLGQQESMLPKLVSEVLARSGRIIVLSTRTDYAAMKLQFGSGSVSIVHLAPFDESELRDILLKRFIPQGEEWSKAIATLCSANRSPRQLLQMAALLHEVGHAGPRTADWGKMVELLRNTPLGKERLLIRAYVPEFAPEDEVLEGLVELYRSLNALHITMGGNGLLVDDWHMLKAAPEMAEV